MGRFDPHERMLTTTTTKKVLEVNLGGQIDARQTAETKKKFVYLEVFVSVLV